VRDAPRAKRAIKHRNRASDARSQAGAGVRAGEPLTWREPLFPLRATTTAAGPNAPRIARRCPGRTNEQTRFPSASEGGRRPQARSARAERAIRRCASNSKYVQSARCRRSWCGRNSCCRRQSIDRVLRTRRAGCRAVYLGHIERVDGLAGERTDVGRSDR
jgi:hypothetical protein